MKANMNNFRVFGPTKTPPTSWTPFTRQPGKFWIAEYFPEDADGTELAPTAG